MSCITCSRKVAVMIIIFLLAVQMYYTHKRLQDSFKDTVVTIPSHICTESFQTIHVAFIVDNTKCLAVLLKSILFYRNNDQLHFHFLANETERLVLETLLNTWQLQSVKYSFYSLESIIRIALLLSNKGFSAKMKLILPLILPSSVDKIIILDTNLVVVSGIQELWMFFEILKKKNKMFSAVKKSTACLDFEECFETNVILFDLQSMREMNIFWNTEYLYRYWFYDLPCEWNAQCGKKYHVFEYQCTLYDSSQRSNIAQYSSLIKIFRDYESYWLQYLPLCRGEEFSVYIREHNNLMTYVDVCNNMKEQSKKKFLTHLFFHGKPYSTIAMDKNDVTLVTQLSVNRVHTLHKLLRHWNGPVSICMYGMESNIMQYFSNYSLLNGRNNVAVHVVYKRIGYYYPINYLRNTALSVVKTTYVFLTDLDFLPSYGLYSYLKKAAEVLMTVKQRRALVVPAFEAFDKNSIFPIDKSILLKQLKELSVRPFHQQFNGHAATNYAKWVKASYPYVTKWTKDYEPYILVKSDVVRYDQRFVGYARNKIAHIAELKAQGYEFIVLPDPFLIHYPHPLSHDRLRSEGLFLKCILEIYNNYLNQLHEKYGRNCLQAENRGKTSDIIVKV